MVAMRSLRARKGEVCRSGSDDFLLGSVFVFTAERLVVTGLLPGAWPASPKSNSVKQLLVDASKAVVAASGISSTFAS